MAAIFGSLLGGITPYVIGVFMLIAVVAGGFGLWEKSEAADQRAIVASSQATINEQNATLKANADALAEMKRIQGLNESALANVSNREAAIGSALAQAQRKVTHAPATNDCQGDAVRGAIVLDFMRSVSGSAATHPDQSGKGDAKAKPAELPARPGTP